MNPWSIPGPILPFIGDWRVNDVSAIGFRDATGLRERLGSGPVLPRLDACLDFPETEAIGDDTVGVMARPRK